jgi:hypothetical protein
MQCPPTLIPPSFVELHLQKVMPDSIVIRWEWDAAGEAGVDSGRTSQYDHRKKTGSPGPGARPVTGALLFSTVSGYFFQAHGGLTDEPD